MEEKKNQHNTHVEFMGNLTNDIEWKQTEKGFWANGTVAINNKTKDGEALKPDFFDFEYFAEKPFDLKKGNAIVGKGFLKGRSFEGKDGSTVNMLPCIHVYKDELKPAVFEKGVQIVSNSITVKGNLSGPVSDIKNPNNGKDFVSGTIFSNDTVNEQESSIPLAITSNGEAANKLKKYTQKEFIEIKGSLKLDTYEKDGVKHKKLRVFVKDVNPVRTKEKTVNKKKDEPGREM